MDEEDITHLLFMFPSSCNIWSMWNVYPSIGNLYNQNQDVSGIIFKILQVLSSEDAALFCTILYNIHN